MCQDYCMHVAHNFSLQDLELDRAERAARAIEEIGTLPKFSRVDTALRGALAADTFERRLNSRLPVAMIRASHGTCRKAFLWFDCAAVHQLVKEPLQHGGLIGAFHRLSCPSSFCRSSGVKVRLRLPACLNHSGSCQNQGPMREPFRYGAPCWAHSRGCNYFDNCCHVALPMSEVLPSSWESAPPLLPSSPWPSPRARPSESSSRCL